MRMRKLRTLPSSLTRWAPRLRAVSGLHCEVVVMTMGVPFLTYLKELK
jgi:hypothetical protein